MLAIVSGGMDSVTLLYAYQKQVEVVLNFLYGSKHNREESRWAQYHAESLGKKFIQINLEKVIGAHFKSALLRGGEDIPEGHYADSTMKKTVVPFRNGIMIAIAAGLAESHNINVIALANHFGDRAIYPDCRNEFSNPMAEAVYHGTYIKVKLATPFVTLSKRDIALAGKEIGVPFDLTYSCYKGEWPHCGRCGTCVERIEALAGFDPTIYEDNSFAKKVLSEWEAQCSQ